MVKHLSAVGLVWVMGACGDDAAGPAPDVDVAATETSANLFATCTYTVKGTLKLAPQLPILQTHYGAETALERVRVKIYENEKVAGVWMGWGNAKETRTNGDGAFSITWRGHLCVDHRYKVRVMFENDDRSYARLEVWDEGSVSDVDGAPWYTVYENAAKAIGSSGGTKNVGTLTFTAGGSQMRGDAIARKHAEIWLIYKDAIDTLAAQGTTYAFSGKVNVEYPGVLPGLLEYFGAVSFADPIFHVVHIHRSDDGSYDDFDQKTLLHEMMHIWAYQHSTGHNVLLDALVDDGGTHDAWEDTAVAFHEGFAEYAAHRLLERMYDRGEVLALNRAALKAGDTGVALDSLRDLQHNDDGWTNMFRLLTVTDEISEWRISSGSSASIERYRAAQMAGYVCSPPVPDFFDVLGAFPTGGSYSDVIDDAEMNVSDFLDRFASITAGFTSADADHYHDFFDPASSIEPRDVYCTVD